MRRRLFVGWAWAATVGLVSGQTQVDLVSQSKVVDFTGAAFTRPLKLGPVLPGTCVVGDMFFNTGAPSGANLYGCVATNTWAGENSGSVGALTVKTDGIVVGARNALNITPGLGVISVVVDAGDQINLQQAADTALLLTRSQAQAGVVEQCASTGMSATAYTCSMSPTAASYTTGMVVNWIPDISGGGPTTLDIDILGAKSIKMADGVTDPATVDILGGRMYRLWYDGTLFRMSDAGDVVGVAGAAQPTCNVSNRGRLWFLRSAAGVKDGFQVCAKDVADAYAWRTLY